MTTALRLNSMLSLEQAVNSAPGLASLQERIRASQRCLEEVKPLIPLGLRQHVKAGPIEDGQWCLLVGSAAASTKLRQLLPTMLLVLNENGLQVNSIRLKVQVTSR
jgi:hypothetical protein